MCRMIYALKCAIAVYELHLFCDYTYTGKKRSNKMSLLKKSYHLFDVFVQFVQFFGRFACVKSFEHEFFPTFQMVD